MAAGESESSEGNGSDFEAELRWSDGRCVVAVKGEVDLSTASRLGDVVDEALGSGQRPVVIDLSGTSFMDSSGIAVLFRLYQEVGQRKDDVVIRGARPGIRMALDLIGASECMTIEETARTTNGGEAPRSG